VPWHGGGQHSDHQIGTLVILQPVRLTITGWAGAAAGPANPAIMSLYCVPLQPAPCAAGDRAEISAIRTWP